MLSAASKSRNAQNAGCQNVDKRWGSRPGTDAGALSYSRIKASSRSSLDPSNLVHQAVASPTVGRVVFVYIRHGV